jgi:hypothetical protein
MMDSTDDVELEWPADSDTLTDLAPEDRKNLQELPTGGQFGKKKKLSAQ